MKTDLLQELLSLISGHGGLERRKRGALLLGKRESGEVGDKDLVLGACISQHFLCKTTLYLCWKGVPGPKVTQQVTVPNSPGSTSSEGESWVGFAVEVAMVTMIWKEKRRGERGGEGHGGSVMPFRWSKDQTLFCLLTMLSADRQAGAGHGGRGVTH